MVDFNQNVYHVSRNTPHEWKVYSEHGNALIGTYPSRELAIREAEVLARTLANGIIVVHREDDSIEREIKVA
jgi:hypothetical protein